MQISVKIPKTLEPYIQSHPKNPQIQTRIPKPKTEGGSKEQLLESKRASATASKREICIAEI
jgi:hypothetical protein